MTELLSTDLYRLIDGRHGRFLCNPQDIYIGRSIIRYGEFSELEWQLFDRMLKPGMVVVEAGANMGAHTVPIAKKLGNRGLVYAFEPQLAIFQQLCANLALNDLVNVHAFNAGAGDVSEWMGIARPNPSKERNYGGIPLENLRAENLTRVRIERLDDALDPPSLHFLKADVEGMEVNVLTGAEGLIAKFRPVLYLEANIADAPGVISKVLELDYEAWWHLPPMFNPANHFGVTENLYPRITSKNILCFPAEREVNVEGGRKVTGPDDHPHHWGQ